MWRFELHADDIGFLELAPPNSSSSFRRVVTDQDLTSEGTFEVTEPGWHRLRGAFADRSGAMAYELRYDPPGTGGLRSIPWNHIRGPAGDLAGYVVDGFDDAFLIGARGSVIHAGTLGAQTLGTDPFGLPVGNSSYSLRFAAQVRIDAPGDYAFRIETSQGHRAWIDGALVADKLDTSPQTSMTAPRSLDAGWHDLAIDLNRSNASSVEIDLAVVSGPAWEGQTIPLDHLRPVVGRGTRWTARGNTVTLAIPDMGTATRTLFLEVPSDFAASRFDAVVEATHPDHSKLELKVDPPNAVPYTIVAAGSLTTSGNLSRHVIVPLSAAGSSWSITATDNTMDTVTGSITYAAVTMIGAGGPAPFAKTYAYVSAPRELGAVTSIANVRWALRQARPGAGAAVSLRTCDDAAACAAEPWTLVAEGAVPAVPPRRFAQYKIEVLSDGDVATAVDWIEIDYRAAKGR